MGKYVVVGNTVKKETPYVYRGTKNLTEMPSVVKPFVSICKLDQKKLKRALVGVLKKYGYEPIVGDGYIYARGFENDETKCPVLLTAHMDTVHKETVKDWYEYVETDENGNKSHIISSPQGIGGDDRCGVFMILTILEYSEIRPHILFCEDEEIGGIGSNKFCKTKLIDELKEMKFLIELDRANGNDLVFYNDDNTEFIDFCEQATGFKEAYGSFSDISNLAPACGVSAVNISCGYYHPHTLQEEVVMEEMIDSTDAAYRLLVEACSDETKAYEYVEYKPSYKGYGNYYSNSYAWRDYYYDYYDDDYSSPYKSSSTSETNTKIIADKFDDENTEMMIMYQVLEDGIPVQKECFVTSYSKLACFGKFFKENPTVCFNDVLDYEFY